LAPGERERQWIDGQRGGGEKRNVGCFFSGRKEKNKFGAEEKRKRGGSLRPERRGKNNLGA